TICVAQCGSVQRRWDQLSGSGARVEARVSANSPLDDLPERIRELTCLFRADEARYGLLDNFVSAESKKLRDGIIGQSDLALKVCYEHRVGSVLNQAFRVGPCFVQLAHVAQDADRPDDSPLGVTQGGGVEAGRDYFAGGRPGAECDVSDYAFFDHFAKSRGK